MGASPLFYRFVMSLDSLPDCVVKCLQDQAESIGCDKDDVQCLCEEDVSSSDGVALSSCVLSDCPSEDMLSLGVDLLSFCDGLTDSSGSGTRSATTTTSSMTRSAPSVTQPLVLQRRKLARTNPKTRPHSQSLRQAQIPGVYLPVQRLDSRRCRSRRDSTITWCLPAW